MRLLVATLPAQVRSVEFILELAAFGWVAVLQLLLDVPDAEHDEIALALLLLQVLLQSVDGVLVISDLVEAVEQVVQLIDDREEQVAVVLPEIPADAEPEHGGVEEDQGGCHGLDEADGLERCDADEHDQGEEPEVLAHALVVHDDSQHVQHVHECSKHSGRAGFALLTEPIVG